VDRFRAAGQGQVFRLLDRLDAAGRARLFAGARAVDLDLVARLARGEGLAGSPPRPEPLGEEFVPREALARDPARGREAEALGRALLRGGKVACVTVAGGQGTRLGFPGPKGCFPIGPGDRTLFDLHAEALAAAGRESGRPIPWVLVVSPSTEGATAEHLRRRGLPGVDPGTVRLARQATVPALDREGRMLLEAPDRIAVSPDGHGGSLRALRDSGALAWFRGLGVEEVSCFQVDNPLAPPADPLFLGLHRAAAGEMSTKAFPRRDAGERVGVVARLGGRPGVVEYTEIPPDLAGARGPEGRLLFGAGNMAAHAFSLEFLARAAGRPLPWHRVEKKVPFVDDAGRRVEPASPNALKFETFLFDALALAARGIVLEVDRSREFAPVKNASGEDTPETARAVLRAAGRWPA